ncbi:MAG: DUF1641 domain-containing protein [Actinomycetia bacterium]|nr:DUF1641 domain-containing protein [Actinomycetes bacterium]
MTDSATLDRTAELERKIDALTEHVQYLTEEAQAQARRRRALEELQADLTPIAVQAIERSAYTLDEVQIDPSDLLRLAVRVAENATMLENLMIQMESVTELATDLKPIVNRGIVKAIELADELDQRGYFEFAEAGFGVIDRIVTGYTKEEVEALGDNVVDILDIFKDLTQPEMLAVADRLLEVVQRQQRLEELEPQEPPSLFGLIALMRDPEVRRGLGRALRTFKAVTAGEIDETEQAQANDNTEDTPGGA